MKSPSQIALDLRERLEKKQELEWKDLVKAVAALCRVQESDVEMVLRAHHAIVNDSADVDEDCLIPNWSDNLNPDWSEWDPRPRSKS